MWDEFTKILTQGASFRARLRHQPKVVYRPAWSRRWWASLPVRGERATTGLRRALSEAGEGTVLARPEAQLSGRARAVVLVANDEAKRPSGSQPRHLSMPSMNSTSRVRPVRSLGGFGRGAQQGAGRFRLGGTCRCLAVVRVLGRACSGAPLGFFGGFRSRTAQPPRSGCLLGWYWRSRARCAKEISAAFYLTQILKPDLGHTPLPRYCRR